MATITSNNKTATVRARINPQMKAKADKILHEHGITHSAFINLSYYHLIHEGAITVPPNIPNRELATALQSSHHGTAKRQHHRDSQSMLEDLYSEE